MKKYTVGIGEYAVAQNGEGELVTYALGSCVAVILAHPEQKTAAMIHIALPKKPKGMSQDKKPGYFADEGLEQLFKLLERDFKCKPSDLMGWIVGGADAYLANDCFNIGAKNVAMAKNILEKNGVRTKLRDTGGNVSRTVKFDVQAQALTVKKQPMIL